MSMPRRRAAACYLKYTSIQIATAIVVTAVLILLELGLAASFLGVIFVNMTQRHVIDAAEHESQAGCPS